MLFRPVTYVSFLDRPEAFIVVLTMPKKGANLGVYSDSIVPELDGETVSKARKEPKEDTELR